ncbi:hypothetical protein G6M89_05775 [Natronolimnobius sp. AArcel1]|uniref:hypothetical protein n=1 Tax=Natronolimnobius sp. AArcel1 TaxID=1679093 RepID=UPI0013EDFE3B|nr:hypothetical protein [Natronolimnobius sp. AArcel1]NGM68524.1 hypothetical protein [Natronolimnobius sp. AArcel1]
MYFETEAFIDEYVIDGENIGIFAGDDSHITYTPKNTDTSSAVSLPTDDITSVTFTRDTSLYRNNLLGWFFAIITVGLIFGIYMLSFAGRLTDPDVDLFTVFVSLLIIGGISTTYDYFNGEDYDIVVITIRTTEDESHVFTGRIKHTEFVEACGELIESDLETRNQNKKLKAKFRN